tara:strand:+ start:6406 stop:7311 length:906 start_codon:yes stop_codon:yes gene_type:complete
MERIKITTEESFSQNGLDILNKIGKVDYSNLNTGGQETTILVVGLSNKINQNVMKRMPNLKIIATPTTGLDHIDMDEAAKRKISVLSLKGEVEFLRTITSTAELAFGMILCLARKIVSAHNSVMSGEWNRSEFRGLTLQGKTLGVIGKGRLGSMVLRYGKSFGMNTIYTDPYVNGGVSMSNLLSESDFVSIHVPLNDETTGLISSENLGTIKKGSYIINTSRGKIVDEKAIIYALESKVLSGYATDVLSDELSSDVSKSLLLNYAKNNENVLLTPHIGGMSKESRQMTDVFISEKIKKHIN